MQASAVKLLTLPEKQGGMRLSSGATLSPVTVAYETYGALNDKKTNAVLVLHSLGGDSHAARHNKNDRPGWWDVMVGPGRPLDTKKYFILCPNVLGGCGGSSGPSSINPEIDLAYALSFPIVTVSDIVNSQAELARLLGIEKFLAVIGPSMGGMQALQWAVQYPDMMEKTIAIASSPKNSAMGIALNKVARQAIRTDPRWLCGDYYGKAIPEKGLSLARMSGEMFFHSRPYLNTAFGRHRLENSYGYEILNDFMVEDWLHEKGLKFAREFDANSYLYLTKAMDYFDISEGEGSFLGTAEKIKCRMLLVSFSSDMLFPAEEMREFTLSLELARKDFQFKVLKTDLGHDAFLAESELSPLVRDFI